MGEYAEIVYGEIAGLKIGLISNEDELWSITRKIEKEPHRAEYFVGFGVGFTKAQQIRKQLRLPSDLSYEDKVQTVKVFLEKNAHNPKYGEFFDHIERYIENQVHWDYRLLSNDICDTTIGLLKYNLLQRALDGIHRYYFEKRALKTLMEFEVLRDRLISLRKKRKSKENQFLDLGDEQHEIRQGLIDWIQANRVD